MTTGVYANRRQAAGTDNNLSDDRRSCCRYFCFSQEGFTKADHGKFVMRFPKGIIAVILGITLFLGYFLPQVTFNTDTDDFLPPSDGLNEGEFLLQPSVEYAINDSTKIKVGADLFEGGNEESLIGQFDDKDRLYVELKYSF
jgi:hypothetical protein